MQIQSTVTQQTIVRYMVLAAPLLLPLVTFAQEAGRWEYADERVYVPASGLKEIFLFSWLPFAFFVIWMVFHGTAMKTWPQVKHTITRSYRYGWLVMLMASLFLLAIPYTIAKIVCPSGYDFFSENACGWSVNYDNNLLVHVGGYSTYGLMFVHWAATLALIIVTFHQLRGHKTRILVFTPILLFVSLPIILSLL